MSHEILQIKNLIAQNNDIICQEYHTYASYSSSFNNDDEIRVTIQSQDLIVLPSESYLKIEIHISKDDRAPFADNEAIFSYNFIPFLFSEMRYEINGIEIDRCKTPGITSLLKNLISCQSKDIKPYLLLNADSGRSLTAGTHHYILPLRFLFGFCDDFRKVILNSKHELILVRSRTNRNMFVSLSDAVTFNVTKLQWKVPHVTLSDGAKLTMLKTLSRNESLYIPFRSWDLYELPVVPTTQRHSWSVKTTSQVNKPRYIVVAFQTNRNNNIVQEISYFDHCNITNMKLHLNNEKYPYDDMNVSFGSSNYKELFHAVQRIQETYYNNTSFLNPSAVTLDSFVLRPIFAFDCSKSDESIKSSMVDVRIEIESSANIPDSTTAHCLIIHDNLFEYSPFSSLVHRVA